MVDDGGGRPVSDCLLLNLALVVIGDVPSLFALVVILTGVAWAECGVFLQRCVSGKENFSAHAALQSILVCRCILM